MSDSSPSTPPTQPVPVPPVSSLPGSDHSGSGHSGSGSARRSGARTVWLTVLLVVVLLGGGAWGAWWHGVLRFEQSTDDAYVAGHVVRIMPRVSGRVIEVLADDTDQVTAGQVLVRLDPTDAQLALDRAVVDLAVVTRDMCRLQAQARESRAQLTSAKISLEQAMSNLQRREVLGRKNAVRVEELHDNRSQVQQYAAQLEAARQRTQALSAQLLDGPLNAQPRIRQAAAVVRECWLALQRTTIRSPLGGQIAQRSVQPGAVVEPGTVLLAVIAVDGVWVDANFKEIQLRSMRIGQPATVRIDLHGRGVSYTGQVAGIAAGTGSVFSLIPPQNATGNWIKIVQRVPVRINIAREALTTHPLLIGLSADVTVNIADESGPLLRSAPDSASLSSVLRAQDAEPDMAPIDTLIARTIADNTQLPE